MYRPIASHFGRLNEESRLILFISKKVQRHIGRLKKESNITFKQSDFRLATKCSL